MSSTALPFEDSSDAQQVLSDRKRSRRRWIVCLIIAAVIGGGAVLWKKVLRDRFVVKNWGVIEDGELYRSGQISPWLIESQLKAAEVDVIIDLSTREQGHEYQEAEIETARRINVELRRFPLGGDGCGDIESYAGAIEAMVECQQEGRIALVHCQAGADRTGGVTYCYRTLVQGRSPEAALEEMYSYGWKSTGNNPLIPYLDKNIPILAEMLVERGVIDSVPDPMPLLPLDR